MHAAGETIEALAADVLPALQVARPGERDAFQMQKGLRPAQPIRRLGKPEEVVSLMVYLGSEDAGFITGQCYLVNGGMYFL